MPTMAAPQPSPPMASITLAATTPPKTSTEPIDRSMPAVMITKVMPTPRTARTAMFCEISEMLLTVRNLPPAAIEKMTTITTSTTRIQTTAASPSRLAASPPVCRRRPRCSLRSTGPVAGDHAHADLPDGMAVAPASCRLVGRGRRSWRRPAPRRWSPRPGRWPPGGRAACTCTRSATSSTCGIEWLMNTTRDALVADPADECPARSWSAPRRARRSARPGTRLVGPGDGAGDRDRLSLPAGHRADLRGERPHGRAELVEARSAFAPHVLLVHEPDARAGPGAGSRGPGTCSAPG